MGAENARRSRRPLRVPAWLAAKTRSPTTRTEGNPTLGSPSELRNPENILVSIYTVQYS